LENSVKLQTFINLVSSLYDDVFDLLEFDTIM